MLGNEPGPSAKAVSALNQYAVSPAHFHTLSLLFFHALSDFAPHSPYEKKNNVQLLSLWVWLISLNMISSSKHITRFCSSWLSITPWCIQIPFHFLYPLVVGHLRPMFVLSPSFSLPLCVYICIMYVHLCVQVLAGPCGYVYMEARGGCQLPSSPALLYSLEAWSLFRFEVPCLPW